jgi:tetratricopeptide (TPR) repeat protein
MAKKIILQQWHRPRFQAFPFRGMRIVPTLMLAAILVSVWRGLPIWAQVPASYSNSSGAISEMEKKEQEAAERIWLRHRELLKQGKWEKSRGELEQLYQWKLNQGIRNHYFFAMALIRESQHLSREGKAEAIPNLLKYAEKMAPDFSQVANARAHWLWSQNWLSVASAPRAAWHWLRGFLLSLYNLEEALPYLANITLWILLSFLITLVIFSVSMLFRYYSFFSHHLRHLLQVEINAKILGALSIFLLFLPFILGLGWIWLFILWLLVFWIYGSPSDRAVIATFLLILVFLPTGIRFHSSFLVSLTGNGIAEITRANTGECGAELYQRLLELKQINPHDPALLQTVGLVEKRMGRFEGAEQNYRQWAQLEPNASEVFNNLGNVYLASNRLNQAVEAYQKAIQLGPSKAEAHYNLGQVYLMNLLLNEAESEFQKAKELKPQLISYYTSIYSRNANRMVIDQPIDPARLWKRVFVDTPEQEKNARVLWGLLSNGVPLEYGELAMAAILALLMLIQISTRNKPLLRNCERCGRLICSRCTRSMVIGNQCSQCINTLTVGASADPQGVKQKRAEMAKYQARRNALPQWFSMILPGIGHLLRDRSKEGIFYVFIFILFLTKIFLWQKWVPSPLGLFAWPSLQWVFVTAFLFLVYYGFVQYRLIHFYSKGGKSHFWTA